MSCSRIPFSPYAVKLFLAVSICYHSSRAASQRKDIATRIHIYLYLAQFIWGENLWDPYPHNFLGYFWSYRQCVIALTSALHCLQLFLSITQKNWPVSLWTPTLFSSSIFWAACLMLKRFALCSHTKPFLKQPCNDDKKMWLDELCTTKLTRFYFNISS